MGYSQEVCGQESQNPGEGIMKYHELQVKATKKTTRVGRGISAGQGKTAGRGTKGQGSRTGGGVRPGFEGGQTPLYMRLPKLRGFTSKRPAVQEVYTGSLETLKGKTVDANTLFDAGLIADPYLPVKLTSARRGKKGLHCTNSGSFKQAIAAIQKAGGSFEKAERQKRQTKAS